MDFLLHHTLRTSAERFPQSEALVDGDTRLTFAQLTTRVERLAAGLQQVGVERGERVGVLLEPGVQLAESLYAISAAQAVFVPMHHSLKPEQVAHVINDCGIRLLITAAERTHELIDVPATCPTFEQTVVSAAADAAAEPSPLDYETLIATERIGPPAEVAIGRDLCAILYTSGSTGKPKGVMLSHDNMLAGAGIVSDYLGIHGGDRLLAALPFSFDAGLNQLTTAVQQGAALVFVRFRFARDIVSVLAKERITGLGGVPPLWNLLAQRNSGLAKTDLPHLRYITNTGGAMPQKTLAALRAALPGTDVVLMYGLTEAFRSTYLPPAELDRRPTSMGRAIPNTEILVVNEAGDICQPGEPGELVHHGPTVSLGYWGQPELTQKVLRPHPSPPPGSGDAGPRVCYSGDIVRTDEDGFLYFLGRRDNLIKSSGFRVSPSEVEDALFQTGFVQAAAVVGAADEMLGQKIIAYVVLKEADQATDQTTATGRPTAATANGRPTEADILTATATRLPRHMVPSRLEIRPALPRTSSGKTNYALLREEAGGRCESGASAARPRQTDTQPAEVTP